jgi:hypothetical protein
MLEMHVCIHYAQILTNDGHVLRMQWVVRYSAGELHKFAKCCYELEQTDLIQHLVVSASQLPSNLCMQLPHASVLPQHEPVFRGMPQ